MVWWLLSPPPGTGSMAWLEAGFSGFSGSGFAASAAAAGILTGSGGVLWTGMPGGGSGDFEESAVLVVVVAVEGADPPGALASALGGGRRFSGGRVFHTAAVTDWRKPLPTLGPTQLLPIGSLVFFFFFTNARDSSALAAMTPLTKP